MTSNQYPEVDGVPEKEYGCDTRPLPEVPIDLTAYYAWQEEIAPLPQEFREQPEDATRFFVGSRAD